MIYLAYFIFAFSCIQLIVVLTNFMFSQKLKPLVCNYNGLVSILIPARNEEKNIANLLHDLQKQEYQNIEIIVFNDLSSDNTEKIVSEFAQDDIRIKLINSTGLPEGWLGKNFACHKLSENAKGKYFLFIDADVRLKNGIIFNSVALVEKHNIGLLSIFPKQRMLSLGERLTVPNMNYILLSLLPLGLVLKSKFKSLAAANGQFMLFNSVNYLETSPHKVFKNNKVEDIAIARYFKQKKIPIACLTGDDTIECRMYSGFNEAVGGFAKNVISFFGNSFIMAIIFWLITTFGFIVVFIKLNTVFFYIFFIIMLNSRIVISIISKQNILLNILLALPQQLSLGLFVYKSIFYHFKNQFIWKGRSIS